MSRINLFYCRRIKKMESWLVDVVRVRIPRPKFESGTSNNRNYSSYPTEPPKDYNIFSNDNRNENKIINLEKTTEDIRKAIQEKL